MRVEKVNGEKGVIESLRQVDVRVSWGVWRSQKDNYRKGILKMHLIFLPVTKTHCGMLLFTCSAGGLSTGVV